MFARDKATSDQPRDRDSDSIDGIASSERNYPYQYVKHGGHRAASHKAARPPSSVIILAPTTNQKRLTDRANCRFSLPGATNLKAEFFNDSSERALEVVGFHIKIGQSDRRFFHSPSLYVPRVAYALLPVGSHQHFIVLQFQKFLQV